MLKDYKTVINSKNSNIEKNQCKLPENPVSVNDIII